MSKKEITIWHELSGEGDTCLRLLTEAAEKLSKEKNVNYKLVKMEFDEFMDKISKVEETGVGPDMIVLINDMLVLEGAAFSKVPDSVNNGAIADSLWKTMCHEGVQKGVPMVGGNHHTFYYNKKHFKTAPKTMDDLINATEELKSKGILPFSIDPGIAFWDIPFMMNFNGWPVKDGVLKLDTPGMKQALEYIADLEEKGTMVRTCALDEMQEKFIKGEIASIINGEWLYNYFHEQLGDDLGVCMLPTLNDKPLGTLTTTVGLAFTNNSLESENKEEILDYARYLISEECQHKWYYDVKRIPLITSLLDKIKKEASDNDAEVIKQMEASRPISPELGTKNMWKAMQDAIPKWAEGQSVDDTLKEMQSVADELAKA